MSTVDFVCAVIMALSIGLAILRGFVREVLTIVAWAGTAAAVMYGLPLLKPVAHTMFESETTANIAAGAFIGIVTLVILSIIAHRLGKATRKAGLGAVDRTLGSVFGAARGALLLCLAYILVRSLLQPLPEWLQSAKSQPYLAQGADKLMGALPASIADTLQPKAESDSEAAKEIPPEKPGEAKPAGEGYKADQRDEMNNLLQKDSTPEKPKGKATE